MTTTAQALKNRLSTIRRDLTIIANATRHAAADVRNQISTIKAASGRHHTPENDRVAERLDRMTGDTTDIGEFLRAKIRDVLLSYAYQRDHCSNSRRAFIVQGADVDQRIAIGMFDELEELIKAASGEAAVEGQSQKGTRSPALPKVMFCRGGSGEVYRLTPGKEFADMLVGDYQVWRESVTTADYMLGEIATGRAIEIDDPKAEKEEPINTATALLAGDMCRLIERRGLGGGLPLVSMLEHVHMLNPVARKVKEELFDILDGKNGVCREDVDSMRFLVDCHCCGWVTPALFVEHWTEAHRKLSAIALGAKP
ncbi:hypothetical protein [Aeromonas phage 59.1]|nr:hypothetical protein [Aeromonas phage 59.1]